MLQSMAYAGFNSLVNMRGALARPLGKQAYLQRAPSKQNFKRTSVQKSNKNEIFMAGSKIQIVSIFPHKQTLVRQERLCIFFLKCFFNFRQKQTFHFHPLESMDRVMTGRKLNTFARFAFQRYYIKGNLTNVCSFIDSFSSIKCKLYRNWLLRSFWPCEKAMCSLQLQKNIGEENLFFHHVPLFRIPQNYVLCKFPKE